MSTILVTGAGGFIGHPLVKALVRLRAGLAATYRWIEEQVRAAR